MVAIDFQMLQFSFMVNYSHLIGKNIANFQYVGFF